MKQIDLSIVNEAFLDSYLKSIDINKIKSALCDIKYKNIIDNLEEIITTNDLAKYSNLCDAYSQSEKKEIKKAFDYAGHRQDEKFMEHFKKLNIKSCPFCNNNYIYFYEKEAGKYNTLATLEHYYPKSKYPHLSLSFYNLIPSCNTCNSKFKGNKTHEGKILHPYFEDFNEKAKFSVSVDSLPVNKNIELEVNLKENDRTDKRCRTSIERFQLDKIYKQHNDIAKEIWNKAQIYNESQIEELYNSFYKNLGYSKEDVKNMIFCNYLHKDDIHKKNHSKLTQDILKQFDLIKR